MSEGAITINEVLRELNISLETAVNFLSEKGIKIETNPNTKITDKEYQILYDEYSIENKPYLIQQLQKEIGFHLKKTEEEDVFGWKYE